MEDTFLTWFLGINKTENESEDVSPEELKAILETSGDLIPTRYQDMLLSILELDKISIEEVMTQRSEIIGIDLSDDFEEILEQLQKNQVDFLPVFDQNLDDLRGMLDLYGITNFLSLEVKDLDNLVDVSDEAYFIPENTSLSQQLFNFQKERKRVGITPKKFDDTEILDKYIAAMVYEGTKILSEQIALKPSDIDVVFTNGYGFPKWRGGPMKYADMIGLEKILKNIQKYSEKDPRFWAPPKLLEDLVKQNKNFNNLN